MAIDCPGGRLDPAVVLLKLGRHRILKSFRYISGGRGAFHVHEQLKWRCTNAEGGGHLVPDAEVVQGCVDHGISFERPKGFLILS